MCNELKIHILRTENLVCLAHDQDDFAKEEIKPYLYNYLPGIEPHVLSDKSNRHITKLLTGVTGHIYIAF